MNNKVYIIILFIGKPQKHRCIMPYIERLHPHSKFCLSLDADRGIILMTLKFATILIEPKKLKTYYFLIIKRLVVKWLSFKSERLN